MWRIIYPVNKRRDAISYDDFLESAPKHQLQACSDHHIIESGKRGSQLWQQIFAALDRASYHLWEKEYKYAEYEPIALSFLTAEDIDQITDHQEGVE